MIDNSKNVIRLEYWCVYKLMWYKKKCTHKHCVSSATRIARKH